jgi:hypothetical protein
MERLATLHQLQNSPPGTVLRERRYAPFTGAFSEGSAEFRSTFRALPPGPTPSAAASNRRLAELDAEIRESEKKLNQYWGLSAGWVGASLPLTGRERGVNGSRPPPPQRSHTTAAPVADNDCAPRPSRRKPPAGAPVASRRRFF